MHHTHVQCIHNQVLKAFSAKGFDVVLWDTPGFMDSNGSVQVWTYALTCCGGYGHDVADVSPGYSSCACH
jgi:hypothetical protein